MRRVAMSNIILMLAVTASSLLFGQAQSQASSKRDSHALEILERVLSAAGAQSVSAVRDISETGEISFHGADGSTGPITIRIIGGSRFRIDTDLPKGRTTLLVNNGVGSNKRGGQTRPLSHLQASNLVGFTTPLSYVIAALGDTSSEISFTGIEKLRERSIYRVRLRGQLGISQDGECVSKDLLVDAFTFDILRVEDHPFAATLRRKQTTAGNSNQANALGTAQSEAATRQIDYTNFRSINGVRLPFSITVTSPVQQTFDISLQSVSVNSGLTAESFSE